MKRGASLLRELRRITHRYSLSHGIGERSHARLSNAAQVTLVAISRALNSIPLKRIPKVLISDRLSRLFWDRSHAAKTGKRHAGALSCILTSIEQLAVRPPDFSDVPTWPTGEPGPPSFVLDYGETHQNQVVIRAAALRGEIHESTQEVRQDAYAIRVVGDQIHIAVCDGVGEAVLSDVGAAIASRVAVDASATGASGSTIGVSVMAALQAAAAERNVSPLLLSTTLCWMRVTCGDSGENWPVEVAEWGNSEAVRYDTRAPINGHPDWSRLAANRVASPTANDSNSLPGTAHPDAGTVSWLWEPGQVLGAFSDGIAASLASNTTVGHALAKAWHTPPTPWEFAGQVAFRSQGSFDDRAAVVLWRRE